jgi:hypothetical protein
MESNVGTTDIAAGREALDQMQSTLWWKPDSGEAKSWGDNFIRILPPHTNMEGRFYLAVPLHFGVGPGRAIVPCPRQGHGQLCPICVEGFRLRDTGKVEDGNRLLPNWTGYINVVVLDEKGQPAGKEPRVRVYSAPGQVLDELQEIMEQSLGDITNLTTGHNVNIRKRVIGNDPKKHTRYQVVAATKPSAFDHPELVESLIDVTKISPYRSADVLAGLLEGEARKDPFAEGGAAEDKPAISGPVKESGAMDFQAPPEDNEGEPEQGTASAPDPAAKPDMKEAQENLKRSLNQGNDGS